MKIAIVGGNSQVGTELCFILRNQGYEVVPIVRSLLGAAFLRHHGFACRVADVAKPEDAAQALQGTDHVVTSFYVSDVGGPSQQSRKIGETIIKNVVQYSPPSAFIAHFSSIRAFSRRVDPTAPIWGTPYDNEKRHGESVLFQACREHNKLGYALRLGHVVGKHQSKTRTFKTILRQSDPLMLAVDPDKPSNLIHTVTIADALMNIFSSDVEPGTYSLVNSPQWTWQEVANFYGDGRDTRFSQTLSQNNRSMTRIVGKLSNSLVMSAMKHGRPLLALVRPKLLPTSIDQYLQYKAIAQKVKSEISHITPQPNKPVQIPEFGYMPIPGPFIQSLADTRALLETIDIPDGIF